MSRHTCIVTQGQHEPDGCAACSEEMLATLKREAEERRLERDVVDAALIWDGGSPPQGADRIGLDRLHGACDSLRAFRKENGTRT